MAAADKPLTEASALRLAQHSLAKQRANLVSSINAKIDPPASPATMVARGPATDLLLWRRRRGKGATRQNRELGLKKDTGVARAVSRCNGGRLQTAVSHESVSEASGDPVVVVVDMAAD